MRSADIAQALGILRVMSLLRRDGPEWRRVDLHARTGPCGRLRKPDRHYRLGDAIVYWRPRSLSDS
jgi:hypothetical protein